MRILLTNDDGYHAPGLKLLEAIARTLSDDVWIVAPSREQSGTSRSLTLTAPLRIRRFDDRRWAVGGTPTDAVMFALGEVMRDARPDLILSGINRGGNLGEDVHYSGTVSAAMEGALAGIRSVALSQRYAARAPGADVSFATAEAWGPRVLAPLLAAPFAPGTLVNVNFPPVDADAVAGIRVVPQGLREYGRVRMDRRTDPRGFEYYWLALGRAAAIPADGSDLDLIEQGYVTVTPLQLDLTHRESIDWLASAFR